MYKLLDPEHNYYNHNHPQRITSNIKLFLSGNAQNPIWLLKRTIDRCNFMREEWNEVNTLGV